MAKKIGAIVSLSIIAILIIATIIMANVSVDYSINCAKPTSVRVIYGNTEKVVGDEADKIVDIISNASKEKSLTALFNGNLNKKAELKVASSVGKTVPSNSGYYVRYRYANPQNLKDGKSNYKDSNGNTVVYDDLLFTVNESNNGVINVYVIQNKTNANVYTYYYELEADFSELYSLLDATYGD